MAKAVELRRGQAVNYENDAYLIIETEHVAKGNKRSYMQVKMRNLKTGQLIERRFRVNDELESAFLEKKEMEYLYSDGSGHVLMDLQSYDQTTISNEMMGDGAQYLKPNTAVEAVIIDGEVVGIELPHSVELKVSETPPAIKGATATNQNKDATLETGLRVKVPPFVEEGELVRVDTRSGQYIERVKGD